MKRILGTVMLFVVVISFGATNSNGDIILEDGEVLRQLVELKNCPSRGAIDELLKGIDLAPQDVLKKLHTEGGLKIILSKDTLLLNETAVGVYANRCISVCEVHTRHAFLHELGHAWDDHLGDLRLDGFSKTLTEKGIYREHFHTRDEYYAEAFAQYYLSERSRSEMQVSQPKTYQYLTKREVDYKSYDREKTNRKRAAFGLVGASIAIVLLNIIS